MSIVNILEAALGFLLATYIHGFIFCLFKANKYENTLAKKIAKEIKND
jgi:hypothetical protein